MKRENATKILKIHSDFNESNSFLYILKNEKKIDEKLFQEIMNSIFILSQNEIEKEQIREIYSIIFWCRSWMDTGWIEKEMGVASKNTLTIYTEIIENALYYLMLGDIEEAFWAFNEFLDGRYK